MAGLHLVWGESTPHLWAAVLASGAVGPMLSVPAGAPVAQQQQASRPCSACMRPGWQAGGCAAASCAGAVRARLARDPACVTSHPFLPAHFKHRPPKR